MIFFDAQFFELDFLWYKSWIMRNNKLKKLKIMKTLLTIALALSLNASSFANSEKEGITELSNVVTNEKTVNITLLEGLGKVKLSILSDSGKKLHQQLFSVKEDMKVPYNLSNLPVGNYYVLIENRNGDESDKAVYSVTTTESPAALPLVAFGKSLDQKSFRLAVVGLEEPGVKVNIIDSKGKTIFTEKINQEEGFTKVYHLKNLTVDDVWVQVTDTKGRTKNLFL